MKEFLLMIHPTFGVLGIIAAVWVIAETLNASPANERRIHWVAISSAVLIVCSWIAGGFLYVLYYAADKALILGGPWPFAHRFFMESKEHLFFITLILALFFPIATRVKDLSTRRGARVVIITTATLVVLSGLAIEGAGAMVALGAKMGLLAGLAQ